MKAFPRFFVVIVVLFFVISSAPFHAQTAQPGNSPPDTSKQVGSPTESDSDSDSDADSDAQNAPKSKTPDAKPQPRISAKEADELFKSVDEILKFASEDTNLPIKTSVKRELATREQVQKYIEERMADDEDQKRFERTELVLKKFGLLPRDFDLRPFMLSLLREQVAGFYDSKRKTVHLLDWIPAESQRPVLAHELTHALQDQKVDLDKWMKDVRESAKKSGDADNAEIDMDEIVSARSALVEGQGMAVLVDYILQPMGRTITDSPQIVEAMKAAMTGEQGATVLDSAPLLLRESLTFPYKDGLGFVQELLKSGGKERAFPGALNRPPQNTHEILQAQDYLENKPLAIMHLPDLKRALGRGYERYDVGSVGQFDVSILLKQFGDDRTARELSPEWRGGMYYAGFKKSPGTNSSESKKTVPTLTSDLAVLYVSRWSTPVAAQKFAVVYGPSVSKRYSAAVKKSCPDREACSLWNTQEGLVSVEAVGDTVITMESFDATTATKLRSVVLANLGNTKGRQIRAGNLSMRVAAPIFAVHLALYH